MKQQELKDKLAKVARALDIKTYDFYYTTLESHSVKVKDGACEEVKVSQKSNAIIRVWGPTDSIGVTNISDASEESLRFALKSAKDASQFGPKEFVPSFSPLALEPLTESADSRLAIPLAPVAELQECLIKAEKKLKSSHTSINAIPYNGIGQEHLTRTYIHSEGAYRFEERACAYIYLYAQAEEPGKRPRAAGDYQEALSFEQLPVERCLSITRDKIIKHLDYAPISDGSPMVVFSSQAFLQLLSAFENVFNAQKVLDQQSLSKNENLGQLVAPAFLNISCDARHASSIRRPLFDSEGTPTRKLSLIQDGKLAHFMHSSVSAKRMNTQPTGHAHIGAKVTVSPHYWTVETSKGHEPPSAWNEIANTVYVDELKAIHAGVNAQQGNFSLPFDGWFLKNGQVKSVESATVAGDFLTLLKSICHLGPTRIAYSSGISPEVWVRDLAITGES